MKTFATHLILSPIDAEYIKKLKSNKGFYFEYRNDPSFSNWVEKNGRSKSILSYKPTIEKISEYKNEYEVGKELLIVTDDIDKADNIKNLIYGGSLLFYPLIEPNKKQGYCYELKSDEFIDDYYTEQSINEGILLGCLAALDSWGNNNMIYSIEKYRYSIELDHITPHSAHPRHGQVFTNFSTKYRSHVNAGYSVFIAYSIIEELGLEIRSSDKMHRFMDNKKGKWNPKVKSDILKRLNDIGVKEDDYMYWIQRGEPTDLQKEIKPKLGEKTKYNDYRGVRDLKLKIYEALHYASYIRNFFVAHKFTDITKYLSPYDIHNIQSLARCLILNKLGLWQKNIDEIREIITVDS